MGTLYLYKKALRISSQQAGAVDRRSAVAPRRQLTRVVGSRSEIKHFSRKAYFRFLSFVHSLRQGLPRFLTLTFPDSPTIKQGKARLFRYLQTLKGQWIWRLDISKKGNVHYHLLYWGNEPTKALALAWERLQPVWTPYLFDCKQGKSQTLYFLKKRFFQKEKGAPMIKNPGRYWGHSRAIQSDPKEKLELTPAETAFCLRLLRKWRKVKTSKDHKDIWVFGSEEECKALYDRLKDIILLMRAGKHVPDSLLQPPRKKTGLKLSQRALRMVGL